MTKSQIIELAHQRTGRKNEGKDFKLESVVDECLADLLMEMRWHWRRKWLTFTTVAAVATYDLTDTTIVTDAVGDIEEVITVIRKNSPTDIFELDPVTDPAQMTVIKYTTDAGDPTRYFLEPGTEATLHLDPIPNSVRTIRVPYWAIANPELDVSSDTIILLPTKYHFILLQYVIAVFWSMLPGEGVAGPNASAAFSLYQSRLDKLKSKHNFSTGEKREFKSRERAVSSA